MSKVEMDLSEYDKMMEIKRLLEKTNEDLNKAYEENSKLKEDVVKALKENEHRVTIIEKKHVRQSAYVPRTNSEIRTRMERILGRNVPEFSEYGLSDYSNLFLDAMYEFTDHIIDGGKDYVHSDSLHTISEGIREDLINELDQEIKNKLSNYDDLSAAHIDLEDKYQTALESKKNTLKLLESRDTEIMTLSTSVECRDKDIDRLKTAITELEDSFDTELLEKLKKFLSFVKDNTHQTPGVFGYKELIKTINKKANEI